MTRKRQLRVQRLENREMMAGDVSFQSGVLAVEMDPVSPHELFVGNSGPYVRITGNVDFGPHTGDKVHTDQVRKIVVVGTDYADTIDLASVKTRSFPNLYGAEIHGGGGSDTIYGSRLHDTIFGGAGHDRIHGLQGRDVIRGGGGNDKIYGGPGRDKLYGGAGDDYLWGAALHADDKARDYVYGGRGTDTYGFRNHKIGKNDVLRGIEVDMRE